MHDTAVLERVETSYADAPPRRRRERLRWRVLALVAAQAVVALDLDVPVLRAAVALVTFVALPTLVLARRATRLPYAFALSLLGLVVGGLLLDTVLPWVGVDHPLAPLPLAVTWLVVDLALLLWRRDVPLVPPGSIRPLLDARFVLAPTLAAVGLLLSVVGAIRLNNGASGVVAVAAVLVGAAALLAQLMRGRRTHDGWVIGLVAAGLLLATSLRGWAITGHDIQAEYLAFRLTDGAQNWEMSALPSAYNACLSVTILPTVLAQATGLSGLVVFKLLLQLVFAVVPVLTYLFARRFIPRRLAFAAAVLTIAFPTFYTDMPYLVRQEMAFFFLATLLLAATERRANRLLVFALGVGVVLSHYSTTYVLLMALVAALIGMTVFRKGQRAKPVLAHPLMVLALLVTTLAWAGPITGTGGHAREVLSETVHAITGSGDDGPSSSDTSYWLLSGDQTSPEERMATFVDATLDYRAAEIPEELQVLPNPGPEVTEPELYPVASTPVKLACALVMQAFLLLGLVWLLRRRKDSGFPREVVFLVWGSMAALGLIVVVPNLSVDYGVLRAFQQTLLVVAPVMAMGMWFVLRRRFLCAVTPVALLVVLAATQQRIGIANAGVYYDRFFTTDSAIHGIEWLGTTDRADKRNERIIANRNVNVRLLGMSDNRAPVSDRLFPTMLSRDGYVFVDGQILDQGESTVFWTGDLLTYTYPIRALDRNLDRIYDAPQARVYR
ncbi:hypothetical protein [Nocardioides sp. SR21]|uniref:hypothetical protein n=1 Tax=Nocardioides sp. SR21 TaxID=2919501 RepID=UPI001FA94437|nr:hypothetical protein [Nocardioides sp. SR21]